jgi:hypothetical protein
MPLFKSEHKVLKPIKEVKFDLERNIQNLVENNLDQAFNLKLVSSEFQLQGLRIDTLAFDEENKSFVIIEYKRDKSQSVIDQGFPYLPPIGKNLNRINETIPCFVLKTETQLKKKKYFSLFRIIRGTFIKS